MAVMAVIQYRIGKGEEREYIHTHRHYEKRVDWLIHRGMNTW